MTRVVLRRFAFSVLALAWGSALYAKGDISPRLASVLRASSPQDHLVVWVYLVDKGPRELQKTPAPSSLVSPRALQRRAKVLPPNRLVDETDLPLDQGYVAAVAARVSAIRNFSRWFNCLSAVATPEEINSLHLLPCVREIDLVLRYPKQQPAPSPAPAASPVLTPPEEQSVNDLNYGDSFNQVNQMNVPPLHNKGDFGQGVIVGVFDNGFRLLGHQAFDSLRSRILATHDFVDHKESVVPDDPNPSFGAHGVNTLSTLAGYAPGHVIGPAFGASFILARTENDSSETPVEEDNWVAAIEWAESLGVQVTSTSLGYLTFDAPYTSLTWQDMDGRTALISRAATMAARKGVVVVNSAGNNHNDVPHNTLNAPADADSIVTAGGVNPDGSLASFSSRGPTIDGRIKPDVVAQATNIRAADATDSSGYIVTQGTSFSCPLIAGVAALLLSDHPEATPMQILNALRATASRASTPDDFYGWGIVNALAADQYLTDGRLPAPASYVLFQNFPNPFNPGTQIRYGLPEPAHVTLRVYNVLGEMVRVLVDGDEPPAVLTTTWDGTNARGNRAASGVYFYRMEAVSSAGTKTTLTGKMILMR